MTDENLTQQTAEQEEPTTGQPLEGETKADEAAKQKEEPKEDPRDAEIARLQGELKQSNDRYAAVKGHSNITTKVIKGIMEDLGLSYEDAAKHAGGISPEDFKARLEAAEVASSPREVRGQKVVQTYLTVKDTLDETYGTDTQQYVEAFDRLSVTDPKLLEEYDRLEPAKAVNFVVREGKKLLERQKQSETLAEENTRLKAELEALKTPPKEVKRTTLPLSAPVTNGGLPSGMF